MPRKPPKLDEYRRLALEATAHAQASGLAHVREKHEKAAAQWGELALLEERRQAEAAPMIFDALCADAPKAQAAP